MQRASRSPDHYNRVLNVDTSYPIIVYRNINEGWQVVLDGLHRLAKAAFINKDDMIAVKYITHNQLANSKIEQGAQIKDVGKKLLSKKALKKPGYYMFGINQHSAFVDNVGALYSICMGMEKTVPQYIREVTHALKETSIYLSLLNGHIVKYFANKNELINSIQVLFGESSVGIANIKFDKWNELFIDLTRLYYDIYVIVLEDNRGSIDIELPIKINSTNDIFPARSEINSEADINVEYIFLFKRARKSRTLYNTGNLYYPIFIITPQEFFKNMGIDKRLYNQNDEIINLCRTLIEPIYDSTDIVERDFNLKSILAFGAKIHTMYVNTKGVCYALNLPEWDVIVPIKYSFIDNVPLKHFGDEKKRVDYSAITSFKSNSLKKLKAFMSAYNEFVVSVSEEAGMKKTYAETPRASLHKLNKRENAVSTIHPLLKVDTLLISSSSKNKDLVVGFVSNSLRFYITPIPKKEFLTRATSDYNILGSTSELYVNYDAASINKIVHNHVYDKNSQEDPHLREIPKIIYEKHLYHLYSSEIMAYFDRERNAAMRKRITGILSAGDLRGKSENTYKSLQEVLLPDYPEDAQRIQEVLSQYYTVHFDRKTLLHDVEHMKYQFDRITINELKNASEGFHGLDTRQREHKMNMIKDIISKVSDKFISKGTPTFKSDSPTFLAECKSDLGKNVSYCSGGKLVVPTKKLRAFIEMFSEEIVNPLRRDYILSAMYISDISDIYKFPVIPGEELYVRFG
jgi:hypothetical protein